LADTLKKIIYLKRNELIFINLSHLRTISWLINKHIMTSNRNRLLINLHHSFFALAISFFLISSCSDSTSENSEPEPEQPSFGNFDAELGERTQYLGNETTKDALIDEDEESYSYTFSSSVLRDAGISLSEGDILLLEGKALRKVRAVTESEGELVVETDFAGLNEAFRNADVDVSTNIDFTETVAEKYAIEYDGKLLKPNVAKDGGGEWSYELDDVTVEGTLETETNKAKIALLVKYDTGDVSGAMKVTSTIENLKNETAFRIEDHETKSFLFNNPGLKGSLDIEFIMAGGNSSETIWEPPMPAVIIPFTIGPIPVVFKMGTVYIYKLDLDADGTATYNTSFSYNGDIGLQVEDSEFTPMLDGGMKKPAADGVEGNAAGFGGTVTGQFGVGLPKISFSMFGETVVPYLMQEFYALASYTFPTCTKLSSKYEVNAGIDMKLFGLADFNVSSNLAEADLHKYESDGCDRSKISEDLLIPLSLSQHLNNPKTKPIIFRID